VRPLKRIFARMVQGDGAWEHTSRGGFACRLSMLPEGRQGVVAVGMSGGVDSSVAALHLQRQVIPLNFLLQIFLKTLLSF
jgi:NH3-dependent NAD+ synthetase